MSTTAKSPKKVARAAYKIAKSTLPPFAHRYSPQKFMQPQLFACLVLKIFFKTDYRGIVAILNDSPELCKCLGLISVPHFTTLQKASKRLLRLNVVNQLLRSTVEKSTIDLAAVDSTGLEAGHISRYFVRRKRSKQLETYEETHYNRFPKLAVVCDCQNHLILSAITTRGPSVDINQFCKTLKPAAEQFRIKHLLADAGYDSEKNHQYARDVHHIKTTIPARGGRPTTKLPKTKYRKEMRTDFDKENYGQRWQVETVFSMIKRNFGSALRARLYWPQCREMMLLILTHNIAIILLVKELFYRAGQTLFFSPSGTLLLRRLQHNVLHRVLEHFFDKIHGLSDGFYGKGIFIIHLDIELFLESGDELNTLDGFGAKVFDEPGLGSYPSPIDFQDLGNDILNSFFDI
jgi:hypothetical protein